MKHRLRTPTHSCGRATPSWRWTTRSGRCWSNNTAPVPTQPALPGKAAEQIPFVTERSRALTDSLVWWSPTDQPGTLTAAVARAAILQVLEAHPDRRGLDIALDQLDDATADPRVRSAALTVVGAHLAGVAAARRPIPARPGATPQ